MDSTIHSPEPWLSPMQCLALLQLVRDQRAFVEAVVAQPSCLSICCARPAQAVELLSVRKPPGQRGERRTDINCCAFVARVTMPDEIEELPASGKSGGGGGAREAAKDLQVFCQATSKAGHMQKH